MTGTKIRSFAVDRDSTRQREPQTRSARRSETGGPEVRNVKIARKLLEHWLRMFLL
jgi:hypothetical protein